MNKSDIAFRVPRAAGGGPKELTRPPAFAVTRDAPSHNARLTSEDRGFDRRLWSPAFPAQHGHVDVSTQRKRWSHGKFTPVRLLESRNDQNGYARDLATLAVEVS